MEGTVIPISSRIIAVINDNKMGIVIILSRASTVTSTRAAVVEVAEATQEEEEDNNKQRSNSTTKRTATMEDGHSRHSKVEGMGKEDIINSSSSSHTAVWMSYPKTLSMKHSIKVV